MGALMKTIVVTYVLSALLAGCAMTPEQVRQFTEGLNNGLEQGREQRCEVGTQCFANLSPEAQQELIRKRDRPWDDGKKHYTCYTVDGVTQCNEN